MRGVPSRNQDGRRGCRWLAAPLAVLLAGCAAEQKVAVIAPHDRGLHMGACVSRSSIPTPRQPLTRGYMGSIRLMEPPTKVIVATFAITSDRVELRDARVVEGRGGLPRSEACDYEFVLLDEKGEELARYGIWDPRKRIEDGGGFVELPSTTYTARLPFTQRANAIQVLKRQVVATPSVRSTVATFCARHTKDPECQTGPPAGGSP